MCSLIILIGQIFFRDYKEIRVGAIVSSLIFIALFTFLIVSFCKYVNLILLALGLVLIYMIIETYAMPWIWRSKRIIKDENNKS